MEERLAEVAGGGGGAAGGGRGLHGQLLALAQARAPSRGERDVGEGEGEESAAAAADAGDEPHEGCGSWEMDRVWTGCLSLGPFYGLDRLSLGPFYLPKSAFLPI